MLRAAKFYAFRLAANNAARAAIANVKNTCRIDFPDFFETYTDAQDSVFGL